MWIRTIFTSLRDYNYSCKTRFTPLRKRRRFRSLFIYTYQVRPFFLPRALQTRLPPLEKSDEHPFPFVCLPIWVSFLFSRLRSCPPASFARKTDSQRTYCASFDRMRVYRQLSAGIAKFCVSVGEIESSLRGNVLGVRGVRFLPVRTKETWLPKTLCTLPPLAHLHTSGDQNSKENGGYTRLPCSELIMELLFLRHERDFLF